MSLPFLVKKPIDLPPIISVELIQITEKKPKSILSFIDQTKDPSHYIKRYMTETAYKDWFDTIVKEHVS